MKVGDEVLYLPHECFALHKDHNGDLPWLIGRKMFGQFQVPPDWKVIDYPAGGPHCKVEVLEGKRAGEYLDAVMRQPDPALEAKNIVLLSPKKKWRAVVKQVNEDGTLNLEVHTGRHGAVLHCDNVPADKAETKPHSCHADPSRKVAPATTSKGDK